MSSRVGPHVGTCMVCGEVVPLVNFTPDSFGEGLHGGYLGGHHRPGTRRGTRCRGSFDRWVERDTFLGYRRRRPSDKSAVR